MKPVAIFRHNPTEGPGHFATFLETRSIPWQLVALDAGDAVPASPDAFSGLAFMGGPMSVNDPLPWIEPSLALIRAAIARDLPVIGHCLGGQLMSRALGGVVTANPHKEIGWWDVEVTDPAAAAPWLGDATRFASFHWHGETFSIPERATRILASAACPNQAFVLGPHLAMQCHVEMTRELIEAWCDNGADEISEAPGRPFVQDGAQMLAAAGERLPALNRIAGRLYSRWIEGLKRD